MFDAGIRAMTKSVASAAAGLGGIDRIVHGHGHADNRGAAPGLATPAYCHPEEVDDVEGDGGEHYFDFSQLETRLARAMMPRFLGMWDGGSVRTAGTLSEGDEVAGSRSSTCPGTRRA